MDALAFFKRPALWVLIYLALIGYGLYAWFYIPVEVLPPFNMAQIGIVVHDPGASAEEIETLIVRPLEAQLLGLQGLTTLRSTMGGGTAELTARFTSGTDPNLALQKVYGAIDRARSRLPAGIRMQAHITGNAINEVADYALQVPVGVPLWKARLDVATRILPALRALPGVQRVDLFGAGDPALWVQPEPLRMRAAGVSLPDIERALSSQTLLAPAGQLQRGHQSLLIEARSLPLHAGQLAVIPVRGAQGVVPLAAVARVTHTGIPVHSDVRLNGQPALGMIVFKQSGASTIPVDRQVAATLQRLRSQLPAGTQWVSIYQQGYLVGLIGHDLGRSLLLGGLLALAVLGWILGWQRQIGVLALSIPVTLLLAVGGLYAFGQTLNLLTLGALAVAVGLLLDDAIIVLEAIYHRWEQGQAGPAGVRAGLGDILAADVTGTLTTVSAYLPLLAVGGLAGLFSRPFALAMSLALLASLLVSLTLIPAVLAHTHRSPRPTRSAGYFMRWLGRINSRILDFTLRRPWLSVMSVLLLLVLALAGAGWVPVNFLPLPNAGVLLDGFTLPPGTSLDETVASVNRISTRLRTDPAVSKVYARIGSARGTAYTERSFAGEIQIVLKPGQAGNDLNAMAKHFLQIAQQPDVQQSIDTPTIERFGESLSGLPQPFEITLIGNRIDTLRKLSERVTARLKKVPDLADVFNNDAYPVSQLRIEPRADALRLAGLTPRALFAQVTPLLRGRGITWIPDGSSRLALYVRLANARYRTPRQLGQLPVKTATGWQPLARLASLRMTVVPNQLRHLDGARAVEILATPLGPLGSVIARAKQAMLGLHLPTGYRLQFGGLLQQLQHTALVLGLAGLAALVLALGVMVLQFGTLRVPLILLLQAPLALTGGLLALIVSGVGLNATSLIGFLTLLGVSLNHGIVLLTYTQRLEREGMSVENAIREAVHTRLRPIVLTTLTALLGMLPIALGWGAGAAPEQGLAIVVMGGVMFSALLSTNLLPALYVHSRRREMAKRPEPA